jgi:hypothetical protein
MGCNGQWKTVFFAKWGGTEGGICIGGNSLPDGVLAVNKLGPKKFQESSGI